MPNRYDRMSPETLKKSRKYIENYNKKHYAKFNIQLRIDTDADVINYIRNSGKSTAQLVRDFVRAEINK